MTASGKGEMPESAGAWLRTTAFADVAEQLILELGPRSARLLGEAILQQLDGPEDGSVRETKQPELELDHLVRRKDALVETRHGYAYLVPRDAGKRIRALRLELGEPQARFAAKLGTGQSRLSAIENGEFPSQAVWQGVPAPVRGALGWAQYSVNTVYMDFGSTAP